MIARDKEHRSHQPETEEGNGQRVSADKPNCEEGTYTKRSKALDRAASKPSAKARTDIYAYPGWVCAACPSVVRSGRSRPSFSIPVYTMAT